MPGGKLVKATKDIGKRLSRVLEAKEISVLGEQLHGNNQFPQEIRDAIFERLAFTPRREELHDANRVALERVLKKPDVEKAWLFGSYGTIKPDPGDLDVLTQLKVRPKDYDDAALPEVQATIQPFLTKDQQALEMANERVLEGHQGWKYDLHFTPTTKDVAAIHRAKLSQYGRKEKKYGRRYRTIRILGTAGASVGAANAVDDYNKGLKGLETIR